jgi:hypothetical protein
MTMFTEREIEYLEEQWSGRLVTVDGEGGSNSRWVG